MRNRIFSYVAEQYGTEPEYLWAKTPNTAVIRHRSNRRWYGIIMDIPRKTVGLTGEGIVDILNVKCEPSVREILLGEGKALPAYHMNKDRWITLLLDGTAEREDIVVLLDLSYRMTAAKIRRNRHVQADERDLPADR